MNRIGHLRGIGEGKRVFLVGNGPSLLDMDLDLLRDEQTIAMNRIDLIYPRTEWRPSYYIFCSSNCENHQWGQAWSKSVSACAYEPGTTPIIARRYQPAVEHLSGRPLPPGTIFLENLSESPIGSPDCFSTNPEERIDKAGTTMIVALQLAYFMGFEETYLVGCDSNWMTATATIRNGDPNHFDPAYHAHIGDGGVEFHRMNETHKVARAAFDAAGKAIYNVGLNSAINAYERKELGEVL